MTPILRARFLAHSRTSGFRRRLDVSRGHVYKSLATCQKPYIALSGGKDSSCTANLVWEVDPSVPAVYFDAACAYPEVSDYLDRIESKGRRIIRLPCRPFLEILAEHGLNSDQVEKATMQATVREPVKRLYEEYGFDAVFMGLRKEESPGRHKLLASRGATFLRKSDGKLECLPVGWWTFEDVWAYLLSEKVDYCAAYEKLFAMGLPERSIRISYWAGESGRRWGRYEALRRGWPALWQKLCDAIPEAKGYG